MALKITYLELENQYYLRLSHKTLQKAKNKLDL